MTPWDLHPIVHAHLARFFTAARRVASAPKGDPLVDLVGLGSNLLWANSPFAGGTKEQDRARSVAGAMGGSLAGQLGLSGSDAGADAAVNAVDDLERQLLAGMDTVLEGLVRRAAAEGFEAGSPAKLDAWVWSALFPGYPWPCGAAELERALAARLR